MGKIPIGKNTETGEEIFGDEVAVKSSEEHWNKYVLEDGTTVRMKLVVAKVVRADTYKPSGEPIYVVHSQNIVSSDSPQELWKKD